MLSAFHIGFLARSRGWLGFVNGVNARGEVGVVGFMFFSFLFLLFLFWKWGSTWGFPMGALELWWKGHTVAVWTAVYCIALLRSYLFGCWGWAWWCGGDDGVYRTVA